jgi:hypothetical protein
VDDVNPASPLTALPLQLLLQFCSFPAPSLSFSFLDPPDIDITLEVYLGSWKVPGLDKRIPGIVRSKLQKKMVLPRMKSRYMMHTVRLGRESAPHTLTRSNSLLCCVLPTSRVVCSMAQ